jgi:hypothetical protein
MQKILLVAALALVTLVACSPALNWREVRPDGFEASKFSLRVMMPCKPDHAKQPLALAAAGSPVGASAAQFHLTACQASGMTFSLGSAVVADEAAARAARASLGLTLAGNIGAKPQALKAFAVSGASLPGERFSATGKRADGRAIGMEVLMFHAGTVVVQAVVSGAPDKLQSAAAEEYFATLKLKPL